MNAKKQCKQEREAEQLIKAITAVRALVEKNHKLDGISEILHEIQTDIAKRLIKDA